MITGKGCFPLADEFNDSVRIMAAQTYLEEIQKYRGIIEKSNGAIEYLKAKAYSVGGYKIRETKVQAPVGQKGAAYESYLARLENIREEYNQNYCRWKAKALSPLISIGKINNMNFQYLLRLRFSSGKAWKEIETGLQCENVFEVRDQALLALSQVMESEGKLQRYVNLLDKSLKEDKILKGMVKDERKTETVC